MRERLLTTLVWLRLYLTAGALGFLFGMSKSTVSHNMRNLLLALRRVGDETLDPHEEQKFLNQEFSRARMVVENTVCQLKHFRVLAERFCHTLTLYDDVFRAVAALVNPRIAKRLALSLTT